MRYVRPLTLSWGGISIVLVLLQFFSLACVWTSEVHAIPAFARKYAVNCHVCHTRWPRLNPFGERFLENGYQMPGTEDGGLIGKARYGDLTLDQVSNYISVLLAGNIVDTVELANRPLGTSSEDTTAFTFPGLLRMYTAGTLTTNIGFFATIESLLGEDDDVDLERGYLTVNNIGGKNWGHLRIGRFDPSAYFSLPTSRPTLVPLGPKLAPPFTPFSRPTINQFGVFSSAFSAKFSGLFQRDGTAILPFTSSLFNAGHEVGIDIHGRPFGDWFLYQFGVVNGAHERFGDSNNAKDWYVMIRVEHSDSDYFSANLSGFAYVGDENVFMSAGLPAVDWSRYGIGAQVRYRAIELLGAFTYDHIANVPSSVASTFDNTASGLTIEAHIILTDRIVTSIRYNHLDAGGILTTRKSLSMLGFQAQYYLRSNIAFYLRDEVNVRDAEGGTSPERNLRNVLMAGVSTAF